MSNHDWLIEEYLALCRARGLTPATLRAYSWALARLTANKGTLPAAAGEIISLLGGQDLAQESKRDLVRVWRTFYRWAVEEHGLVNPLERPPRLARRRLLPRVLSEAEVQQLLGACNNQQERALVALVLDTGLRLGEVASLRWSDVHPGHLRVLGKVGCRQVPISDRCRGMLAGLGDGKHIWTGRAGPLTISGVQQVYLRIFRRAGVDGRKRGPHVLRHTFATMYIRVGGNVRVLQEILGHQALATTMIYVHLGARDVALDHAHHSPLRLFMLPDLLEVSRPAAGVN